MFSLIKEIALYLALGTGFGLLVLFIAPDASLWIYASMGLTGGLCWDLAKLIA